MQTGYAGPRRSLVERAIAAARLDSGAYEEVEADATATSQAAAIVAISALAQAISEYQAGVGHMLLALGGALIGWIIGAAVIYIVGVTLFKGTATVGELLRTLGFAQAPGVLYIVSIVPLVGTIAKFAISIWILVATVIAIRQALDITTGKAIVTGVVAWLLVTIPLLMFGAALFALFR